MSTRSRILGFGSAALLIVAGGVCTVILPAGLAEDLALGLIGLGVVEATSLVFLEVGFSEDRERARERESRERESRERERPAERASSGPPKHSSEPARPGRARLPRMRGRPRRLR